MKKFLKWTGIILGALLLILVLAVIILNLSVNSRLRKSYSIRITPISISASPASLERGARRAILCQGCHGVDFSGSSIFDDPKLGSVAAPNLTRGKGGIGATYSETDWIRSVRHGVRPDGTPLLVMPANDFHNMCVEDLSAVIACIRSAPPVDKEWKRPALTFLAKAMLACDLFGDVIPAESIDHAAGYDPMPDERATPLFGGYLVRITGCRTCHGQDLAGGHDPNPDAPPGPNLTPGGNTGGWSAQDFIAAMRRGMTPQGQALNGLFMPWKSIGRMNDTELTAIHLYLRSLPPKASAAK